LGATLLNVVAVCQVLHFSDILFIWAFGIINSNILSVEIKAGVTGIQGHALLYYIFCAELIKLVCNFYVILLGLITIHSDLHQNRRVNAVK
jgi:hypothetical protein